MIIFASHFQGITVHKATKDDQGTYSCTVVDHSYNTQTKSEFIRILEEQESYLRIWLDGYQNVDKTIGDTGNVQWVVQIAAHPEPVVEWQVLRTLTLYCNICIDLIPILFLCHTMLS